MNELITIAISEMSPNTFKVVTYDIKEQNFKALQINKEDFFFNNNPVWDMFALTKVMLQKAHGEFFTPVGVPVIEKIYDRDEMRMLFHNGTIKQNLASRYFESNDLYGVVKIDYVDELHEPVVQERFQQRIDFTSGGFEKQRVLIKDYKWITYWQSLRQDQWDEKIEQWEEYLQNEEIEIFAVLFRLNQTRWICGFHCL